MNKTLSIRIAEPEDAGAILNIYSYYVENTAITFEYEVPFEEEFRERIVNTLRKYPYLVAEKDGQIIGYAYAGVFKGRAAYDWDVETSIYVDKDAKKQGIGRQLYEALEKILRKQNIVNLYACITCPETDDEYATRDSIHYHEKMGYRLVGEFRRCGYKFGRWYSMVWMEKQIGEKAENQKNVTWFSELATDNSLNLF